MNFVKLEGTWFTNFWKLLTENCSQVELEQRFKSVVFVIFNYDRCIEHYLYHSLQNTYPMSASEAAQLIKCIEIYHPYGTVGPLPWLSSSDSIMYGGTPNSAQLLMLAKQIKTFTEGTDESSSEVNAIRSNMEMSNRLIFLGFAFHKLNMDLLFPTEKSNAIKSSRHVFATAQGISASDIKSITTTLINKGKVDENNIYVQNDLTCNQLFREYWRSIAFV